MRDAEVDPVPAALITGAARGMGAATAELLARSGWDVALLDACDQFGPPVAGPRPPSRAELERVAERCRAHAAAVTLVADVRSADSVREAVIEAKSALGGLDAAVAAAGKIFGAPAWETPEDAWAELLEVNLHGVRHLAEAVVPGFVEARAGRFVAVSSAAGLRGLEKLAAYGASKHAVIGYVRGLAADLRGTGVTANVVCPGSTDTEMLTASAEIYGLSRREEFAPHQLLDRILAPEEVAATIAFLCGPGSSAMTGAVITADGGMTV